MRTDLTSKRVSAIIPTFNAGEGFAELLDKLRAQTVPPHEILVVDSSSRDGTVLIAERFGARVYRLPQSEFDHGGTRNWAASMTEGELLLFMTQDAVPVDARLIERLVRSFEEEDRVACAYARQVPHEEANALERWSRLHNYPEQSAVKTKADVPRLGLRAFFCSNVCCMVRRDVFEAMGRFVEPSFFNEDLFFAAKCLLAGYTVVYNAEAQVRHSHNYTLMQLFRRFFDNGVSMRRESWILPYAKAHAAGSGLVRMQLNEIFRRRMWRLLPRLVAESAVKYLGFQLGKRYRLLPKRMRLWMSMHPDIWRKIDD